MIAAGMADRPDTFQRRSRGFVLSLVRRGARLRLPQTAGSLAFLSLLAIVPVFAMVVSLLGAMPVFDELRESLLGFLAANLFLPKFSATLVGYLNQFAEKANELSLLGAVLFFATAFSALLTIDHTLNRIWDTDRPRPLSRRLTLYWMFLTLGPLLVAASFAVNGLVLSELFTRTMALRAERVWLYVLPWLTTVGGLTLLYRLVPNAPVRWRDALIGALVAAVLLDLLKRGLAFQVARLPTYTVVYGTFAALPLFLVWLFLLWLTVLAGALVSASLPFWGAGATVHLRASAGRRFDLAAGVLAALAAGMARGAPGVPGHALRTLFAGDAAQAEETGRLLVSLGYIDRMWRLGAGTASSAERAVWDEHWQLAPEALERTLRPLFDVLWRGRGTGREPGARFEVAELDRPLRERFAAGPNGLRPAPASR